MATSKPPPKIERPLGTLEQFRQMGKEAKQLFDDGWFGLDPAEQDRRGQAFACRWYVKGCIATLELLDRQRRGEPSG